MKRIRAVAPAHDGNAEGNRTTRRAVGETATIYLNWFAHA
jgi:hypothetical protein